MFNQRIDVIAAGETTGRNGDVIADWDNPSVVASLLGWCQPVGSQEVTDNRDLQRARFIVYLLPGHGVVGENKLVWNGRTLDVSGPERQIRGARGVLHHVELDAIETVG